MSLWPADYIRPGLKADHCQDVIEGAYDVPFNPDGPVTVLDLGANIGAFARWAAGRWPQCTIHCYEPHPENFKLLQRTAAEIKDATLHLYQLAVLDRAKTGVLIQNGVNCGEYTLANAGNQVPIEALVDVISAVDLPKADILKIDTEGAEWAILTALHFAGRLKEFSAVMVEYHAGATGRAIPRLMRDHGFTEVPGRIFSEHRGELKFIRA